MEGDVLCGKVLWFSSNLCKMPRVKESIKSASISSFVSLSLPSLQVWSGQVCIESCVWGPWDYSIVPGTATAEKSLGRAKHSLLLSDYAAPCHQKEREREDRKLCSDPKITKGFQVLY